MAFFNNDGPLGVQNTRALHTPAAFFGIWFDLWWLGTPSGSYLPNISSALHLLLNPLLYANLHVPISQLLLGLCAAYFFRTLGFGRLAIVLGGLAAALNSDYFSHACWGLSTRSTCLAMIFLALAALSSPGRWGLKSVLAGLAIGMSIAEGADNGAIFSLYVAAYAFYRALHEEGSWVKRLLKGGVTVALMAVFAGLLSFQTIVMVTAGAAKPASAGAKETPESKAERWDWATQWSLPKAETLRVIIPGLYGYRMDTAEGGNYRGGVGRTPGWEKHRQGFPRHSGAGEYAGVLVVLVALWGLLQGLRKTGSVFNPGERRLIWFWGAMALVSLLLAWGRHAPFYQLVYALPYFSNIRNPLKFMHPFHLSLLVLFAYGLQGMARGYLAAPGAGLKGLGEHWREWWRNAGAFDRRWVYGMAAAAGISLLGWLVFAAGRPELIKELTQEGFDAALAAQMAGFATAEIGYYLVFLVVSAAAVGLTLCGALGGPRSHFALALLGLVLVVDLGRANAPWIKYYSYKEKLADSPMFQKLREKRWEHRVAMPPFQIPDRNFGMLQQIYHVEWMQHQFPYYNIQSLDIPQEPRLPADKAAFRQAVGGNLVRYWELTNTRYLFGMSTGFAEALNQQLDKGRGRFKVVLPFTIAQERGKEHLLVETNTAGPFALIEFTGALPRAKLYPSWQVNTNDEATLKTLADPAFDPAQTVLVSEPLAIQPAGGTNAAPGTVEHTAYEPWRVELKAKAAAPAVLLLNDRYDANWKATVNGQPAKMLRCNFIMRGVELPAGEHTVVFEYRPDRKGFWVMLGAEALGALLLGWLILTRKRI